MKLTIEIKSIRKYARKHGFNSNLTGLCAIASHWIARRYKGKLQLGFVFGRLHSWVKLQDGTLIDITASQFGYRNGVVPVYRTKYYKGQDAKLNDYYVWHDNQIPCDKTAKRLNCIAKSLTKYE